MVRVSPKTSFFFSPHLRLLLIENESKEMRAMNARDEETLIISAKRNILKNN